MTQLKSCNTIYIELSHLQNTSPTYYIKTTDVTKKVIETGIAIGVRYTMSQQHKVSPLEVNVLTVTKTYSYMYYIYGPLFVFKKQEERKHPQKNCKSTQSLTMSLIIPNACQRLTARLPLSRTVTTCSK